MRANFIQQQSIGVEPISKVKIPDIIRDELPPILKAIQHLFVSRELNKKVFEILSKSIKDVDVNKGRKGMSLWEIFVLAVIRNGLDTNYDRLHDLANHHLLVRKIMGVHTAFGYPEVNNGYGLQTIKDNVKLISRETIDEIDSIVVANGQSIVKKKRGRKTKAKH